jgi:hypothetical protein
LLLSWKNRALTFCCAVCDAVDDLRDLAQPPGVPLSSAAYCASKTTGPRS